MLIKALLPLATFLLLIAASLSESVKHLSQNYERVSKMFYKKLQFDSAKLRKSSSIGSQLSELF